MSESIDLKFKPNTVINAYHLTPEQFKHSKKLAGVLMDVQIELVTKLPKGFPIEVVVAAFGEAYMSGMRASLTSNLAAMAPRDGTPPA